MNRPYGPAQRADVGIGPSECQALYGAWQYGRLFGHFLNSSYSQVWAGAVPQGRQPYYQRAQAEPSPERFQVLQVT